MSEKILIASDSTSDLSAELIARYGVKILPLGVTLGEKQYTDGVDIDPDLIYQNYEQTGTLPKTSAINMADASAFFAQYVNEGYTVIFFTISSEMSSTYQNVRFAASEFENVYVVDTKNLSTGGGLLVVNACEMAAEGKTSREIVERCEALTSCVDASFVIDSLEFLHKGGRCSSVAALGANLLKLHPMIQVKDGKMSVAKKYRGKMNEILKQYVSEKLADENKFIGKRLFITHSGNCDEIALELKAMTEAAYPDKEVLITRAGCTVACHCGPGTLGILGIRENNI